MRINWPEAWRLTDLKADSKMEWPEAWGLTDLKPDLKRRGVWWPQEKCDPAQILGKDGYCKQNPFVTCPLNKAKHLFPTFQISWGAFFLTQACAISVSLAYLGKAQTRWTALHCVSFVVTVIRQSLPLWFIKDSNKTHAKRYTAFWHFFLSLDMKYLVKIVVFLCPILSYVHPEGDPGNRHCKKEHVKFCIIRLFLFWRSWWQYG